MPLEFDIDKMNKLPEGHRFFDVNALWYLPNRWTIKVLYPLPVSANQITFLALAMGGLAACFYLSEHRLALVGGAVFLYGKLFLDNVDGNLARVRGEESRFGRFFDSFTDFAVTVMIYSALTWRLVRETGDPFLGLLGLAAMMSSFLQCSYFVYYLVNYTAKVGSYKENRPDEAMTGVDRKRYESKTYSRGVFYLQRIHNWVYGWQDQGIEILDRYSRKLAGLEDSGKIIDPWYADKVFLSLSSPLCICTNTMALAVFSLMDRVEICFLLIVFLGNAWLAIIQVWKIYRFRSGFRGKLTE